MDLVNFFEKNQKLHIQIRKKSEKPRFYEQNKLFFESPAIAPLGSFSHMATCRSSLENT
jgi:hypothetical protein